MRGINLIALTAMRKVCRELSIGVESMLKTRIMGEHSEDSWYGYADNISLPSGGVNSSTETPSQAIDQAGLVSIVRKLVGA